MGTTSREPGPVEELARTSGPTAWQLALVTGANQPAATRAALHAVVIAAVEGGAAAEPAAILALARTWALSSPGVAAGLPLATEPVAAAFWSLPEPLRVALWCTDVLGLSAGELDRVLGGAAPAAAAVARGRVRRRVCQQRRVETVGTGCGPCAAVLGKVLADHAAASKVRLVATHVTECRECARLLEALRHPAAAIAAVVPPAPDLVVRARTAWREHVGARRHPLLGRAALTSASRSHRPVVAALALVTAGSLGAATSQLAVAAEQPAAPAFFAAPVLRLVRPPAPPAPAPLRRQAEIPPLAGDALLAPHVTRDLAEVAPVPVPAAPAPVAPAPPAPPVPAALGEPLPAVDRSTTIRLSLLPPLPLPVDLQLGPTCSSITLGPLRLDLPCRR